MVASGLTGDAIYVKPTKLALHFIFALGLLSYTFWFAMELLVPDKKFVINRVNQKSHLVNNGSTGSTTGLWSFYGGS